MSKDLEDIKSGLAALKSELERLRKMNARLLSLANHYRRLHKASVGVALDCLCDACRYADEVIKDAGT